MDAFVPMLLLLITYCQLTQIQGRSDGGYIGIYIPPNQSTLIFMWLFCPIYPPSLRPWWLVNIYTHPNQIPGYASAQIPDMFDAAKTVFSAAIWTLVSKF